MRRRLFGKALRARANARSSPQAFLVPVQPCNTLAKASLRRGDGIGVFPISNTRKGMKFGTTSMVCVPKRYLRKCRAASEDTAVNVALQRATCRAIQRRAAL